LYPLCSEVKLSLVPKEKRETEDQSSAVPPQNCYDLALFVEQIVNIPPFEACNKLSKFEEYPKSKGILI